MTLAPAAPPDAPARATLAPIVVGVDHHAPIALRERIAAAAPAILERLAGRADEAALLSTCNRTELYLVGAADGVLAEIAAAAGLSDDEASWLWCCDADDAARHLFGVAAGLESQLLGETEILRQVRVAAQSSEHAGPVLSALFRHALAVGKRARARTEISRGAASVGSAAAAIVRADLPLGERRHAVVVGAGDAAARVLNHLRPLGFARVDIVNRTVARAALLAAQSGGRAFGLDALPGLLAEADAVLCATSAPEAVVTLRGAGPAVRARKGRRLLLLDLAVPRDVEPAVADLPAVRLYDLDAVQARATDGVARRASAAGHVRALVEEEVAAFGRWQTARRAAPAIAQLRATAEARRQQLLALTHEPVGHTPPEASRWTRSPARFRGVSPSSSPAGPDCRAAVAEADRASRAEMRRLLHAPTVALRRGESPDLSALTAAGYLP